MPRYTTAEHNKALEQLREWLKPGATVFTIVRHVSRSGMSRSISVFASVDGQPCDITYQASRATAQPVDQKHGGIRMSGCGMDMGFALVYDLSRRLYPDGFGVMSEGGIRPRTKEQAAQLVAEDQTTFHGRNGDVSGWDNDGGYALRHRWL